MTPKKNSTRSITIAGPRVAHPLAGLGRGGFAAAQIALVAWLSRLGWTSEQIVAVLLILLPVSAGGQA